MSGSTCCVRGLVSSRVGSSAHVLFRCVWSGLWPHMWSYTSNGRAWPVLTGVAACLICRRAFSSLNSWASHAARLHGYRAHSTKLAQGQTCLACGKIFATPGRLKRHLDHASDCCRHWGAFQPTPDADDGNSHLQAPPVVSGGERVDDYPEGPDLLHCQALDDELQAMTAGNAFDVLNVVSKHCAPLKVLRCTVTRWYESFPDSHSLKEPAEDVKLTLYPEYVTDSVQPFRKSRDLWHDEPPVLNPLTCIPFVCSGEPAFFSIPPPCSPLPVFPWQGFYTLKEARARLEWAQQALSLAAGVPTLRIWRLAGATTHSGLASGSGFRGVRAPFSDPRVSLEFVC